MSTLISLLLCCFFLAALFPPSAPLQWPAGKYGLPQAQSGCPSATGFKWETGHRFQDLYDLAGQTSAKSSSFHLQGFVNNNDVRRDFCMKISTTSDTGRPNWPKGTYCIYRKGGSCPAGFSTGYIKWDDYDHFNKNSKGGTLPDGTYDKNTVIQFCCRRDGNKKDPMSLPSDKDFFLLAYLNTECQSVKWFIKTTEWINYDTHGGLFEKNDEGGAHPYIPDTDDRKIHYCYYKRCKYSYTADKGVLKSPNNPGSYPAGQYCSWLITVASKSFVKISFTSFKLEDSAGCNADYVAVYDGKDDSAPLLGKYCGSVLPNSLTSTARTMFLVLKTDGKNNFPGFSAKYETQVPPTTPPIVTSSPVVVPSPSPVSSAAAPQSVISSAVEPPASIGSTAVPEKSSVLEVSSVFLPSTSSQGQINPSSVVPVVTSTVNPTSKPKTNPPEVTTTQPDYPADYSLWPKGYYGLPEADHGCPLSGGISWETGYRFQDTDDGRHNNRSANFHLDAIVGENVRRDFCIKTNSSLDYKRPAWPKGVYCIYQKNGTCPAGFTSGWVLWDDEDRVQGETNDNAAGGSLPDGQYHSDTKIYYCCRDDGDKNTPVVLPPEDSFFLLAYKTPQCQKVKWTVESLEFIQFRTESSTGTSDTGGTYPYGASASDHKIHYCYHFGCKRNLTDPSGVIHLPTYPLNYTANQHCAWAVAPVNASAVYLNFTFFSLENSAECTADSLKVYDGVDETAPLIGQYCGGQQPPLDGLKSSGPAVYLLFQSNDQKNFGGFEIQYKPANATPTTPPPTTTGPPVTEITGSTTPEGGGENGPVAAQKSGSDDTNVAVYVVPVAFILLLIMVAIVVAYLWQKRRREHPDQDQSLKAYFKSLSLSALQKNEKTDADMQFAVDNPLYDTAGVCNTDDVLSADNAMYDCAPISMMNGASNPIYAESAGLVPPAESLRHQSLSSATGPEDASEC